MEDTMIKAERNEQEHKGKITIEGSMDEIFEEMCMIMEGFYKGIYSEDPETAEGMMADYIEFLEDMVSGEADDTEVVKASITQIDPEFVKFLEDKSS